MSKGETKNSDSGFSNSSSTEISEEISIDWSDVSSDEPNSSETSGIVYSDTIDNSLEPIPNILDSPFEYIPALSSNSVHSSTQWSSPASISSVPNAQGERTIISFHGVSGKIETFGTSIFITMQGKVVH